MKIILLVAAGVVIGLVLFAALVWFWIKRKIGSVTREIRQLAELGAVSPLRVSVEPAREAEWSDLAAVDAVTASLGSHGYEPIGDFRIAEMDDVRLRAFLHGGGHYAALYEHDAIGLFADLAADLLDGTQLTVSSAPESGLDVPPFGRKVRVAVDLRDPEGVQSLHRRFADEAAVGTIVPGSADGFAQCFMQAYAREMDWRIDRGGVTAEEVARVAALHGLDPPSEDQVAIVQSMWASAIGEFVEERVIESFLAGSRIPAAEWERQRERAIVVSELGDRDGHLGELAYHLAEADSETDEEQAEARVRALFTDATVREGFAAAQALLPAERRYDRLASVEQPWPADIWLMPQGLDE